MNHWHLAYPFFVCLLRLIPFFFYPYRAVSLKRVQNKVKLIRWWWGTNKKKHELNLVEMSNGAVKVFVGSRTRHCGIVFHFPLGQTKIDEHGSWRKGKNLVEYGKVATEVRGDKGRHCQLSVTVRGTGLWLYPCRKMHQSVYKCCSTTLLPLLCQFNVINLSAVTKVRNRGTKLQERLNLEPVISGMSLSNHVLYTVANSVLN